MAKVRDWAAVARAVDERMVSLEMTQAELASKAGVALETVREVRHNIKPRRRHPRTLAAISEALGWRSDHLAGLLDGTQHPADAGAGGGEGELAQIRASIRELSGRVAAIERQLGDRT